MTETEFRIKYSEIMQYFQSIEFNLKRICAALVMDLPENWDAQFDAHDSDTMGRLINTLEDNKGNLSKEYITEARLRKLKKLKERRNYWAHHCFYSQNAIYLIQDRELGENVVKYKNDEKIIKKDYGDAREMAEKLDDVYFKINNDTSLSDYKAKEIGELLSEHIPIEISSINKIEFFSGEEIDWKKK